jgi:outer membrane murein-binding lipoprotein Lpp
MKALLLLLTMTLAISFSTVPESHAKGWFLKKAAKGIGKGIKKGAKGIGKGIKKGAKGVGKAGKWVGKGAWKGIKGVGKAGKWAGKGAWKGVKGIGKAGKWALGGGLLGAGLGFGTRGFLHQQKANALAMQAAALAAEKQRQHDLLMQKNQMRSQTGMANMMNARANLMNARKYKAPSRNMMAKRGFGRGMPGGGAGRGAYGMRRAVDHSRNFLPVARTRTTGRRAGQGARQKSFARQGVANNNFVYNAPTRSGPTGRPNLAGPRSAFNGPSKQFGGPRKFGKGISRGIASKSPFKSKPAYQPQGRPAYQPQGRPAYQPQGRPAYQPQGRPAYQQQAQSFNGAY